MPLMSYITPGWLPRPSHIIPYSGKNSRIINFAVFEDLTTASKINSSKSYYSIESYDSLVDPQNLIREIYRGEITLKFSASKITRYTVCVQYKICI